MHACTRTHHFNSHFSR